MKEKIAFVGTGRMGGNMARRLHDCGYPITAVHDAHAPLAGELAAELGTVATATLAGTTAAADIIFTVVTDDAAQLRIFAETGDSLLLDARGKIFVNCATLTPAVHREVARRARKAGARTLEGCMASSMPQARQGTLYLMCAGERPTFDRVQPVLVRLSSALRYVGSAGRAAEVKALVNQVMNINTAGLAEALGLGQALGIDLDLLREVFAQTGANSQVLKTDGEDMQNRAHECFFSASHAAKDAGIAAQLARDAGLNLPLTRATKEQFDRMVALGLGQLDKSGVAELTFPGRQP
jgi:3-hydroxyisobutyrate dehydrogenase